MQGWLGMWGAIYRQLCIHLESHARTLSAARQNAGPRPPITAMSVPAVKRVCCRKLLISSPHCTTLADTSVPVPVGKCGPDHHLRTVSGNSFLSGHPDHWLKNERRNFGWYSSWVCRSKVLTCAFTLQAYGLVGGLAPEAADLKGAAALPPPRIAVIVHKGEEARQVGLGQGRLAAAGGVGAGGLVSGRLAGW